MNTHFTLKGQIVDLIASRIFAGCVTVENGKIVAVESQDFFFALSAQVPICHLPVGKTVGDTFVFNNIQQTI